MTVESIPWSRLLYKNTVDDIFKYDDDDLVFYVPFYII